MEKIRLGNETKNRFQEIFQMTACVLFFVVPSLHSQVNHEYYLFYVSGDNHVRELHFTSGRWFGTDLTAATNGPQALPSGLTSFFDGSIEHVFYVSYPDYHVRELYYTNGKWWGDDPTAETNGPTDSGELFPELTSFFDGSGHVFYISGNGDVRELYYTSGRWWGNDPTAETNGPQAWSSLTSFFDGSNEHVFYVNYPQNPSDYHLHELYYSNGSWSGNDLTAQTNGPVVSGAGLTSFFDGSEHVFFVSYPDLHIREMSYISGLRIDNHIFNLWFDNDLTADTNGPSAARGTGALDGYSCCMRWPSGFFDGSIDHLFYVSGDSHVRELYHTNGK